MTRAPWVLAMISVVVLARGGPVAKEEEPKIHVCEDRDGNVSYQSDPCEVSTSKPIPTPIPAATAAPIPRRPAPRPRIVQKPPARRPGPTVFPNLQEDEPPEEASGPMDARLGSPEKTWRTFLGALRSGDRALASACLTSAALLLSGPDLESLPVDTLRARADALPEIDFRGDAGPFRVATARRRGPRPKWIFFEKNRKGEWKITAM